MGIGSSNPGGRTFGRDAAREVSDRALAACREFGLVSERAVAVLFDVMTQNGGIPIECARDIHNRLRELPATPEGGPHEVAVLEIIAVERAKFPQARIPGRCPQPQAGPGSWGGRIVHGDFFELDGQYGIGLRTAAALAVS
jgi:hypothetical protein